MIQLRRPTNYVFQRVERHGQGWKVLQECRIYHNNNKAENPNPFCRELFYSPGTHFFRRWDIGPVTTYLEADPSKLDIITESGVDFRFYGYTDYFGRIVYAPLDEPDTGTDD